MNKNKTYKEYKEMVKSTTSKLTRILCTTQGVVRGALTMGVLSFVVFVTLHFAKVPAGGKTTWIILGALAVLAVARGVYVAKSELWRLEHYHSQDH